VTICTQCAQVNPEGFQFCGACGTALVAAAGPAREVRKTVTALFCDVVGSTPLGERLDPEELRSVMRRYFAEMRVAAEGHGGRVEKFIGDAVLAVFGVPQLHEDDALRAVRAAGEMRTRLVELNESLCAEGSVELEARMGVCTGEVVVGGDDQVVLGDVMNTAARLEQAAEPGEILVADETWILVRDAVAGESVDLVVKGKATSVRAWRLRAVGREVSGHQRRFDRPLVGREREVRVLQEAFGRAVEENRLQLVTIIGEPGIGKSRLVAEFEQWIEGRAEAVVCRRGRCLAYGDGIGFWPLAEIVKQQLEIAETDSEDQARARLAVAVEGMQDAPWLRARLAPLVGLAAEPGQREEVFGAWQRFFDEVAARTPLVLVIEDLHWADPAMLAFVQHLVEWSTGVPILVACTARPELFEAHSSWAGGLANATTLALGPLNRDDTTRLADVLLAEFVASADAAAALVERCGGNPLYAEEYARLLADRATKTAGDLVMPETVRALIGARIVSLPDGRKALLHDAAVVGKVFWAGALAAIGDHDPAGVRVDLHELARKELIRRSRTSTLAGDEEYAFWHDLVHDVAYQQIPRVHRADTHRRTAEWIEQTAGERIAERAELLAHHYSEALILSRSTQHGDQEPLRKAALQHLTTAAKRAMGLDTQHATRLAQQGLDIAAADAPERAALVCLLGESLVLAGEYDEACVLLRDARAAAETTGDAEALAEAFLQEAKAAFFSGDAHGVDHLVEEATDRLSRERATAPLALLLGFASLTKMVRVEYDACRELHERAIEIAETLHDQRALAMGLNARGAFRGYVGDRRGLDDLEASLGMLVELGSADVTQVGLELGWARLVWNGPVDAAPILAKAVDDGARTRNPLFEMFARSMEIERLSDSGSWDELLEAADHVLEWAEAHQSLQHSSLVAPHKARVLALRGHMPRARTVMTGMLEQAQRLLDAQLVVPAFAAAALIEYLDGNTERARQLAQEIRPAHVDATAFIAEICRILVVCDVTTHARMLIDQITAGPPRLLNHVASGRALLAEADGDYASADGLYQVAAARWQTYGNPYELAYALAGRSRCLHSLTQADAAKAPADEAAAIFQRLGVRDPVVPRLPDRLTQTP
jgi:class 3 adenylate cyclase/tetratricopeptide (TPR) repeat protein